MMDLVASCAIEAIMHCHLIEIVHNHSIRYEHDESTDPQLLSNRASMATKVFPPSGFDDFSAAAVLIGRF